ncbi:MAG: histidinol phosphate phosphatase domain-containing protein [bacterium]
MIDLHMHTTWSDGALIPAETVQRARHKGVRGLALTDHVDSSNLSLVVPALVRFCRDLEAFADDVTVLPGLELTHVPPESIAGLAREARRLGAQWIAVHGETLVEPVPRGTNHAAIMAGVDLLAHPGLIEPDDVKLAAKNGVALEISARKGHSLTNGRVAALGKEHGAVLLLNTDAHEPCDLIDAEFARQVALGAGLSGSDFTKMQDDAEELMRRASERRPE